MPSKRVIDIGFRCRISRRPLFIGRNEARDRSCHPVPSASDARLVFMDDARTDVELLRGVFHGVLPPCEHAVQILADLGSAWRSEPEFQMLLEMRFGY
jgi:hypothetical protein